MAQSIGGTLYASAARTATPTAVEITANTFGEFSKLEIHIDVTATNLTPSVVPSLAIFDDVSGTWITVLTGAAITATGETVLRYGDFPNVANLSQAGIVGPRMQLTMTHADTDSITYSVGYRVA